MRMTTMEELETNLKGFKQTITNVTQLNDAFNQGLQNLQDIQDGLKQSVKPIETLLPFQHKVNEALKNQDILLNEHHQNIKNGHQDQIAAIEKKHHEIQHSLNNFKEQLNQFEQTQSLQLQQVKEKIETYLTRLENDLLKAFMNEFSTLKLKFEEHTQALKSSIDSQEAMHNQRFMKLSKNIKVFLILLIIANIAAIIIHLI